MASTTRTNSLLSRNVPGGTNAFYTFDPQGSVCQRFDRTANPLSTDEYDAYGALVGSTQTGARDVFGYGAQWGYTTDPETGLLLLTNRYYDPGTARFLTRDPIGAAGGLNLYGYCGNNPSSYADPLGLVERWQYVGGGAALGAVVGATAAAPATPVASAAAATIVGGYAGTVAGSLYDSAEDFGFAVGCYEGGQASVGQVIWSGAKAVGNVVQTALFIGGTVAPAIRFPGANVAYRFATEGEVRIAQQTGEVPNTTAGGDPKQVFLSTDRYSSAREAEDALQIGRNNPMGATPPPTHIIEVDLNGVRLEYGGPVQGGTGTELVTLGRPRFIRAYRIRK